MKKWPLIPEDRKLPMELLSQEQLNELRISCLREQIQTESDDIGTMRRIALSDWASDKLKAMANETINMTLEYIKDLNEELDLTRKEIRLEKYRQGTTE
jgi:hypothetical protein